MAGASLQREGTGEIANVSGERKMKAGQSLEVYLHGVQAGVLAREGERLVFRYDPRYLARSGARPLSRRLPLTEGPSGPREAYRWFDALLPEGERRAMAAAQAGAARTSTYSMLEAIGAECAGAVEVHARRSERRPRAEALTEEELEGIMEDLRRRPLGPEGRAQTLSLAGAQAKLVLVERGGGWRWPVDGYPSTHIVKPEQDRFPGLVENEHACMELARRAGLPAAATRVERVGGRKAIVVTRFDRKADGSRVHQEDFCQALGVRAKYQKDRGPSLRDCFERSGVGGWPLWDQATFAWLIGDEDKHAKNYSVQYPLGEAPILAPVYDAVCTLAWPELERGMAMRIGRAWRVDEVDARALRNEAGRCGLEPGQALERLRALAEKTRGGLEAMKAEGWDVSMLEQAGIEGRLDRAREAAGGR